MSTLGNIVDNYDFFMIVPPETPPWIAHAREDGYTVMHAHPDFFPPGRISYEAFTAAPSHGAVCRPSTAPTRRRPIVGGTRFW